MSFKRLFKLACADHGEMTGSPAPWGVLYAPPNADGSRKKCENCFMWVKEGEGKCIIHDKKKIIKKTMVCGYHVYGTPFTSWIDCVSNPLDPKTTGLAEVGEGTSCDTCLHFKAKKCYAVSSKDMENTPAKVDPKGCCARWTIKK